MKRLAVSLSFLMLLSTGCTLAVRILPLPTAPAPVKELSVQFAHLYRPGTFIAEFDGQNVTQQFDPAGKPDGKSTMTIGEKPFTGGSWIRTSQTPPGNSFGTVPSDIQFPPSAHPINVPTGSGTGTSTPNPNIPLFNHLLHVEGQCNGMICDTTDDMWFFPVHLVGMPQTLTVKIGTPVMGTVEAFPALSSDLPVQIIPISVSVRINDAAPGAPATVIIPAGGHAQFRIAGVLDGGVGLILQAGGTQSGSMSGVVNR